jgi:hypothetical protein
MLRRDLPPTHRHVSRHHGLSASDTRDLAMAPSLAGKGAFVSIGYDQPQAACARACGDYDKAVADARIQEAGLPISLSAVVPHLALPAERWIYRPAGGGRPDSAGFCSSARARPGNHLFPELGVTNLLKFATVVPARFSAAIIPAVATDHDSSLARYHGQDRQQPRRPGHAAWGLTEGREPPS